MRSDAQQINLQFNLNACYGSANSREWVCMMEQHVDSTKILHFSTDDWLGNPLALLSLCHPVAELNKDLYARRQYET